MNVEKDLTYKNKWTISDSLYVLAFWVLKMLI